MNVNDPLKLHSYDQLFYINVLKYPTRISSFILNVVNYTIRLTVYHPQGSCLGTSFGKYCVYKKKNNNKPHSYFRIFYFFIIIITIVIEHTHLHVWNRPLWSRTRLHSTAEIVASMSSILYEHNNIYR